MSFARASANLSDFFPAFYRQSLQIQHLHAELYHNATALRGIDGPEDVQKMPQAQRDLAIRSIQLGRQILDITVNSPAYREGMKYGMCRHQSMASFAHKVIQRYTIHTRLRRFLPRSSSAFRVSCKSFFRSRNAVCLNQPQLALISAIFKISGSLWSDLLVSLRKVTSSNHVFQ